MTGPYIIVFFKCKQYYAYWLNFNNSNQGITKYPFIPLSIVSFYLFMTVNFRKKTPKTFIEHSMQC